jgi:hypothetical protein
VQVTTGKVSNRPKEIEREEKERLKKREKKQLEKKN